MRGAIITSFVIFILSCLNVVECFNFWNASQSNVTLPSRLVIDSERNVLVVAANNSICHLSTDLKEQYNVRVANPVSSDADFCMNTLFESVENCQNYPHVLTLSSGSSNITSRNGTVYPVMDTILLCGSNALNPQCVYRHRSTLEVLKFSSGLGFCPFIYDTGVISMSLSSGQLVSAAPTDIQGFNFRISISDAPYNGQVTVATLPSNQNWFYNSPTFVSMHEIGDYIYFFFLEIALETPNEVVYSRVARICKNDTGSDQLGENIDYNVFTTFLKARISCTSGTGSSNDIPFHYNEIQDTFFVSSGSPDGAVGSEQQLFAVFNSARNGPVGSAVCVFTFNEQDKNNVATVFNADYLRQNSDQQWVPLPNYEPFTCEPGSRTLQHARDTQLMKNTAASSNGPRPLLTSEKYLFDKIVVSQVTALDNKTYDVMFIAAHSSEELVVIKASLAENEEYRVIYTEALSRPAHISQMQQDEQGHIYLTTDDGVYGFSMSNCSAYTDCCSCVAAMDPFCAYDKSTGTCVFVSNASPGSVQDVANGDTGRCTSLCGEVEEVTLTTQLPTSQTTPPSPKCVQSTITESTATSSSTTTTSSPVTFRPDTPQVNGLGDQDPVSDHTYTIVGSVVSFVAGVFLGILVTAFFFRRANIFRHSKNERMHRRRRDLEGCGNERKSLTIRDGRKSSGGFSANVPKSDMKNNNVRPNEYTPVHQAKSSPGRAAKFSATYPSLHDKCDSQMTGPVPVPAPTTPSKKLSAFSFDSQPSSDPPNYSSLSSQKIADPNLKSNLRTEETITNQQRAAYGPNILARAPSIDATKHSKYSKTTLPVVSPTVRYSTQPTFVKVSDVEMSSSQC